MTALSRRGFLTAAGGAVLGAVATGGIVLADADGDGDGSGGVAQRSVAFDGAHQAGIW